MRQLNNYPKIITVTSRVLLLRKFELGLVLGALIKRVLNIYDSQHTLNVIFNSGDSIWSWWNPYKVLILLPRHLFKMWSDTCTCR